MNANQRVFGSRMVWRINKRIGEEDEGNNDFDVAWGIEAKRAGCSTKRLRMADNQ